MPKNIVICCDGTNGQFGLRNTNVVRLFELLEQDPLTQVAFYDPGLGTLGDPGAWTSTGKKLTKALGLAFGRGLAANIGTVYQHLMAHYEAGDQIYLIGFSRGAYTVRALAALLHMFGLIRNGNEHLVPYVTQMFGRRDRTVFALANKFKPVFSRTCEIKFVGVWDTVSSVGWISNPVALPFTRENPSIKIARHAVAIDERRAYFRPNLFQQAPGQDLKQVWFAGVHSDVGGGYPEAETGLANIALWWMIDEANRCGLRFDATRVSSARADPRFEPDPLGRLHRSLTLEWLPLEAWPKRYWDWEQSAYKWRVPFGGRRFIDPKAEIHPSVDLRRANAAMSYRPPNCP